MKTFAAVTYNVLAQSFAHPDRYPLSCPEALDPTRRHALLLDRIEALDADLLCLQELEPAIHADLHIRLPWDTCAVNGRPRKLDYLLFTTGRFEPHPGQLPKLSRDTVLPSRTEPSDHLPLRVDFSLVPR